GVIGGDDLVAGRRIPKGRVGGEAGSEAHLLHGLSDTLGRKCRGRLLAGGSLTLLAAECERLRVSLSTGGSLSVLVGQNRHQPADDSESAANEASRGGQRAEAAREPGEVLHGRDRGCDVGGKQDEPAGGQRRCAT